MSAAIDRARIRVLAFYAFALLGTYLVVQLFRPFLVPLVWAGVVAITCYPIQQRFERRFRPASAAGLTTACIGLAIMIPMVGIASAFVAEASGALNDLPRAVATLPASAQQTLESALHSVPGGRGLDATAVFNDLSKRVTAYVSAQAAGTVHGTLVLLLDFGMTMFAVFFFLRDAPALMAALRRAMPIESELRDRLFQQAAAIVAASVRSSLVVAAVQGLLCGLSFWIVGLPAPLFWGVVTAICCLLPLGAWVVWLPAAVWLALTGHIGRGLLLAGFGAGIVSAVDNVLRPMLLSGEARMNGLLLFISIIGGVGAFGAVGLVAGPVIMAAGIALFEAATSVPAHEAVTPATVDSSVTTFTP